MPDIRRVKAGVSALLMTASVFSVTGVYAGYPIAGLNPSERPAGAPVIKDVHHDAAWYKKALTGINPPYPRSFRFLDNQGEWYTPFIHPGMLPPYDIRGWHRHH